MIKPLIILFLLGALQGAVGWIMVLSGLTGDAVYVRPAKLALHFVFALGLIAYTYWFALSLSVPSAQLIKNNSLRRFLWVLLVLLFMQLLFGALMAGNKAATVAPTWPDINGAWIPSFSTDQPFRIAIFANKILIHFIHRSLAYILFILTLAWTIKSFRVRITTVYFKKTRLIPFALVTLQAVLGIIAVLKSTRIIPNQWGVFEWFAEFHQVTAILYLLSIIWMLYIVRNDRSNIISEV